MSSRQSGVRFTLPFNIMVFAYIQPKPAPAHNPEILNGRAGELKTLSHCNCTLRAKLYDSNKIGLDSFTKLTLNLIFVLNFSETDAPLLGRKWSQSILQRLSVENNKK